MPDAARPDADLATVTPTAPLDAVLAPLACPLTGRLARRRAWIVLLACAVSLGLGAAAAWLADELAPPARISANPGNTLSNQQAEERLRAAIDEEMARTDD